LGWPAELQHVRVEPGGLHIKADQSLLDAGVTDGAWLVFSAEPVVAEAPAPPRSERWPVYVPQRHATREGGSMGLRVLAIIGALLLSVAIGFLLLRPQPTAAPQALAAPTTIPTLAPAAAPT